MSRRAKKKLQPNAAAVARRELRQKTSEAAEMARAKDRAEKVRGSK